MTSMAKMSVRHCSSPRFASKCTEAAYKHRQKNSLGHSRQMPCELSPHRRLTLAFHDGTFPLQVHIWNNAVLVRDTVLRPHVVPLFGIDSQEAEILDLGIDPSFGHLVPSVRAPEDALAAPIFIPKRPGPWYTIRSQSHIVLPRCQTFFRRCWVPPLLCLERLMRVHRLTCTSPFLITRHP